MCHFVSVPMIRLLTEALESSGCPVDLSRHIVCEECDLGVSGGYDQEMNQIVICQDSVSISKVISTMSHELIHMFDNCTTTMDYQNNDHLACTEIRAANLTGCSFLKSVWEGTSKFWDVDQTHQVSFIRLVQNLKAKMYFLPDICSYHLYVCIIFSGLCLQQKWADNCLTNNR